MNKYKLSQSTIEKLKYYVYLLSDPRTSKVFYVGKGCGSRILNHLLNADDKNTKETEKIKKIREIHSAGKEVGLTILRHGLTEKEAFEIESSIIDFIGIEKLTNIVSGHDSFETRGRMSLKNIKIEYEAKKAVFKEPVMLIRINKRYRYDMSPKELYDATRKEWKVGDRAKEMKIACSVYAGIIREVYEIKNWVPSDEVPGRLVFNGKVADTKIREKYIDTSVAHIWKQGSQNPIKYVG